MERVNLCFWTLDNGNLCMEQLREIDEVVEERVWRCPAGHVWYGSNPEVLFRKPRAKRARRKLYPFLDPWRKPNSADYFIVAGLILFTIVCLVIGRIYQPILGIWLLLSLPPQVRIYGMMWP